MTLTVAEVAQRVGGTVEGNGALELSGLAGLVEAQAGDLSFLANPRYAPLLTQTQAGAVIVNSDWKGASACTLIRVASPDQAFAMAAEWFAPPLANPPPGIHPTALVASDVQLGRDVSIGAYCVVESKTVIGDRTVIGALCHIGFACTIGNDCRFYPLVSLREHTRVGHRVLLHNGCVLGSDGFGYANEKGKWKKIRQIGIVEVGDDVEIGANATVDRARFGVTRIGNGVKIDNLVQIAHNVTIGEDSAMAAQVGISGSTHVGKRVRMGGQAGIAGHLMIGDDSVVGAQAGVIRDVDPRSFVAWTPAMPHPQSMKVMSTLTHIVEMRTRLAELERRLAKLEGPP